MTEKPENTVHTIDCHYIQERLAAAYLMVEGGRAAFVENNTVHAVPHLLAALARHGLDGAQVDYLIITHVHLDHAGGTAALLKHCPNAVVLAQERAAPHIIDPARLIKGAQGVYGKERFAELYGEIKPVPSGRVRVVADGEVLSWGGRKLTFFYTRGHAKHHMCIYDSGTNGVFTGDSFGLAYPRFRQEDDFFVFPSTSPPDFDPDEARAALDRIVATGAERAYLTHFGLLPEVAAGYRKMGAGLDRMRQIRDAAADTAVAEEAVDDFCYREMTAFFEASLADICPGISPEETEMLSMDIKLNAMGVAHAARRLRRERDSRSGS